MIITLRNGLAPAWGGSATERRDGDNPALLFERGLPGWAQTDAERRNGDGLGAFVDRVARQPAPAIYTPAYARWLAHTADAMRFARWIGRVDGRLFAGLGGAHVAETNLTLARPYGVPSIPGSSLKGVARTCAAASGLDPKAQEVLFGREPDGDEDDGGEAGYLVFHDAWWVPESATTPFAAEIVTVHHQGYYGSEGAELATDFDSPVPCPQLAARGSFLFVVEGAAQWAELGLRVLRHALETAGVGGKGAAGYGRVIEDTGRTEQLREVARLEADAKKSAEERRIEALRRELEAARERNDRKPGGALGAAFNATAEEAKAWPVEWREQLIPLLEAINKYMEGDMKKRRPKIETLRG